MRATNANARIEIGVCDDTSLYDNNFTPIDTITVTEANSWQQKVSSHLSRYSGTGRHIAFRMSRSLQPGNSVTIYIDNLIIEPCGIWQISRRERGIDDFYVQWTNVGSPTVDIEIGSVGFIPGTGTMHSDVTSPYHFTGLQPGTTYQLRFYTTCNGIIREQTGINASTLARNAHAIDLCEGFEDNGDNIPSGWRRPTTYDNTPRAYTSAAYTGSRGLFFRPYYASTKPIAALPRIDTIDINQLSLSFMLRSSSYNTGYIEIGVMEYPEYASSFIPVDTVYANTSWTRKKIALNSYAGNGHYIAFRAANPSYSGDYLYIDKFDGLATGGMPSGWSRPRMYDSRPRIWNDHNRSGDRALQLRAYGNLNYNHSVAVMPMFDVDSVRGLYVYFYAYGTNNYNPRIQVGVMDNPNDESTFTPVRTETLNAPKLHHH